MEGAGGDAGTPSKARIDAVSTLHFTLSFIH